MSVFLRTAKVTVPSLTQSLSASYSTMSSAASFFDLKADTPKGQYDFKQLDGKVTLIVNVASKCGFTPQYEGLEKLYKSYNSKGLEILGFQFGGQEPGSAEQIESFCQINHGVTFTLMKKSDVNGDAENPVYGFLKSKKSGLLGLTRIKWNFEKFLVDQKGEVVARYGSITRPEAIGADIEKLLAGETL